MSRRRAIRAVLLTKDGLILLMRVEEPLSRRQVWITPGGAVEQGESVEACLRRELEEETGLQEVRIGPLIWTRAHNFEWNGRAVDQYEEYHLVDTTLFEPTIEHNPALGERSAFRGFRWWAIGEIRDSTELFAPRRLAELLDSLVRLGPPEVPVDIGI